MQIQYLGNLKMEKRIRNKKLQLLVTAGRALWTITVDQISLCGEQHFFSALLSLCGVGGSSLPKQMLFSSCFFCFLFFLWKKLWKSWSELSPYPGCHTRTQSSSVSSHRLLQYFYTWVVTLCVYWLCQYWDKERKPVGNTAGELLKPKQKKI